MAARKNTLEATLRQAVKDLREIGCSWALVGGIAVSARVEPRATRDVDVAVAAKDDSEAEGIVHELQLRGYRVVATVEQEAVGRLATARLKTKSGLLLDLLFASSGIEREIVESAEVLAVIPRLRVPVASVAHLLAMKVLARDDRERPQDSDDIKHLLEVAKPRDVAAARRALALVTRRGYHREKKLAAALERSLRESSWRR